MIKRSLLILVLALWCGAVLVGGHRFLRYEGTATQGTAAPGELEKARSPFAPESKERFSLVVFLHPGCSCSRATLAELSHLLASRQEVLHEAKLVFVVRPGFPDLRSSDLWKQAQSLPKALAVVDEGGKLADAAGDKASGAAFLYDPSGRVLFRGGLTASRGHEGFSKGQALLQDLLDGKIAGPVSTPIFGCALAAGVHGMQEAQMAQTEGHHHDHE